MQTRYRAERAGNDIAESGIVMGNHDDFCYLYDVRKRGTNVLIFLYKQRHEWYISKSKVSKEIKSKQ